MRSAGFTLVPVLCAGLLALSPSVPALAQPGAAPAQGTGAPAAVKKRKPAAKLIQVQVLNKRDVGLVELAVLGTKDSEPLVIASGVGPGGKMIGKVPASLGCVFTVSGSFDDESTVEVPSVNLCKDPRITLVE